ncbi:TPA: hypothetical protein HA265_07365 [Candidatus Woesearchaeota archaeon]|nr:hypothetical protein [Candidatus Woesearchaeota archaeon]
MIDLVFPKNDENAFIALAERLGLQGLCFVYDRPTPPPQVKTSLKLFSAVLCTEETIRKYKGQHLTVMRCPSDQSRIRLVLEQSKPDILFGLEFSGRSDFIHHRASGLNHIHADLARKNDIIIGFSFSDILSSSSRRRSIVMGRLSQNIIFARKFGFTACIASFAAKPYHLRSPRDLSSFFEALGMHPSDAASSLGSVFKRLETINKR